LWCCWWSLNEKQKWISRRQLLFTHPLDYVGGLRSQNLPCRVLFSCDEIVEITLDFKRHAELSCGFKFRAKDRRRNEAIVWNKYRSQQKKCLKKNQKEK
jgi:hypothetical protein